MSSLSSTAAWGLFYEYLYGANMRTRGNFSILPMLLLVCMSSAATCEGASTLARPTIRLQVVSTIPETLTYSDEGFGDFIRAHKDVPVTSLSINQLAIKSLTSSFESLGLDITMASSEVQPGTQEDADSSVAGLPSRNDVDLLVVMSQGRTPSERGLKGMTVMTKIGLLGIEKLSVVFTMPKISIYSRSSTKPCVELEPVRMKRIAAIYANWSADMTNGPSAAMHTDMQAIVGNELPLAIEESIAQSSRSISQCLRPVAK